MDNASNETKPLSGRRSKGLVAKSKMWIEDENGEAVFGEGRLRILEAIEKHGSIHAAAQELQMSYRALWGKIQTTERRLGQSLLERKTGGVKGGGSALTPFAKQIIERFKKFKSLTETAMDGFFEDFFPSDKSSGE
jgi:molybdate transport system regulatory protein